jgi:hypothetical protein
MRCGEVVSHPLSRGHRGAVCASLTLSVDRHRGREARGEPRALVEPDKDPGEELRSQGGRCITIHVCIAGQYTVLITVRYCEFYCRSDSELINKIMLACLQ